MDACSDFYLPRHLCPKRNKYIRLEPASTYYYSSLRFLRQKFLAPVCLSMDFHEQSLDHLRRRHHRHQQLQVLVRKNV